MINNFNLYSLPMGCLKVNKIQRIKLNKHQNEDWCLFFIVNSCSRLLFSILFFA